MYCRRAKDTRNWKNLHDTFKNASANGIIPYCSMLDETKKTGDKPYQLTKILTTIKRHQYD